MIDDQLYYSRWGVGAMEYDFYRNTQRIMHVTFKSGTDVSVISEMINNGMTKDDIQDYINL